MFVFDICEKIHCPETQFQWKVLYFTWQPFLVVNCEIFMFEMNEFGNMFMVIQYMAKWWICFLDYWTLRNASRLGVSGWLCTYKTPSKWQLLPSSSLQSHRGCSRFLLTAHRAIRGRNNVKGAYQTAHVCRMLERIVWGEIPSSSGRHSWEGCSTHKLISHKSRNPPYQTLPAS